MAAERFSSWIAALEQRALADLSFAELRKGLQALSSIYVSRRGRVADGGALDGAGKRAAFAAYFAPLHYLTVAGVVAEAPAEPRPASILDLGCGTGVAGAAWAHAAGAPVTGWDLNRWALGECRWNWRQLGVSGRCERRDAASFGGPRPGQAVVLAYTVNELGDVGRERLLPKLLDLTPGSRALVVEPIARRISPWWDTWAAAFEEAGGGAGEWSASIELPDFLARLDRAAGLDHAVLKARTLSILVDARGKSVPWRLR